MVHPPRLPKRGARKIAGRWSVLDSRRASAEFPHPDYSQREMRLAKERAFLASEVLHWGEASGNVEWFAEGSQLWKQSRRRSVAFPPGLRSPPVFREKHPQRLATVL